VRARANNRNSDLCLVPVEVMRDFNLCKWAVLVPMRQGWDIYAILPTANWHD